MKFWLRWPVESRIITQHYGERVEYYRTCCGLKSGHEGLDFRAANGSKVFACADGVVSIIDFHGDESRRAYGNYVVIQHTDKYATGYAHLQENTIAVRVGQKVKAGEVFALADNTGNSSAAHLHLNLLDNGKTVNPEPFLEPYPHLPRPDFPMRGLHGDEAAHYLLESGLPGWAVETAYANGDYKSVPVYDVSQHEETGIRVILRLNHSYAKSDGGLGTFPAKENYDAFAEWCISVIQKSKGFWGFIIGNEPNRAGERPDWTSANPGTVIQPGDTAYIFNAVWSSVPVEVRVSPAAIDPTNYESGDPLEYFKSLMENIKSAEFFALHAYGYSSKQSVTSTEKFLPPMAWQYHSWRMWQPFADVLYDSRYRRVPMIITETNHLHKADGSFGWDNDASTWINEMYNYGLAWNRAPGEQYVHGSCLYRYTGDVWAISDKPRLLEALKLNGAVAI